MPAPAQSRRSPWPTVLLSVAVIPLIAVVGGLLFGLMRFMGEPGQPSGGIWVQLLPAQLTLLLVAWAVVRRQGRPVTAALGLIPWRGGWRVTVPGVLGCLALSAAADASSGLFPENAQGSLVRLTTLLQEAEGAGLVGLVLMLTVPPAIAEECFYRGLVQRRLRSLWGPGPAIAVSTLAFAIVHMDTTQSLLVLPIGAWLGWLGYRVGSIWPCVIAHGANNLVAACSAAYGVVLGDDLSPVIVGLTGGVVAVLCGVALVRLTTEVAPTGRCPTSSSGREGRGLD